MTYTKYQRGSILPLTMFFVVISFITVFSYFKWAHNKRYTLNYRIAAQKAQYNAEAGLAERAFGTLINVNFQTLDTTFEGRMLDKMPENMKHQSMGGYQDVRLQSIPSSIGTVQLVGTSTGIAWVKSSEDVFIPVTRRAQMVLDQESLAAYMYLTASEKAGGGPYVFNAPGERRNVTFGVGDVLGGGNIQSNGTMVMSDYGCPTFENTVWITYGQSIDLGMCNPNQVFQGDPDTLSRPPVKLPPSGYYLTKNAANFTYDATDKLSWDPLWNRDTLIMTELVFNDFGYHVKQWWFLKPPHIKELGGGFTLFTNPNSLDYTDYPGGAMANCFNVSAFGAMGDLRTCAPYMDSLALYHAKVVSIAGNNTWVGESPLDNMITGNHGITHFDYKPIDQDGFYCPNCLIYEDDVYYSGPTVIYVRGGPVLVRGTYNGRYTIVTDEYITYHRHAWPTPMAQYGPPPLDTLWCNIWLTDDLLNVDHIGGSLANIQPDEFCEQGSNNIMGLVSGANVVVAATRANGLGNRGTQQGNINVHAAIIAFNESFVQQYWQNTVTTNNQQYSRPPWGDGRGVTKNNGGTGNQDYRGYITVWGGIVQKYRGYMVRNAPGPYNTGDIGMDKDYHYDNNLMCGPPPYFPSIEFENNEKSVKLAQYGVID